MIMRTGVLACGALSLIVHMASAVVFTRPAPVEIAGTTPAAARLGNSFADVAAGSAVSVPGPSTILATPVAAASGIPEKGIIRPTETSSAKPLPLITAPTNAAVASVPDARVAAAPAALAPVSPETTVTGTEAAEGAAPLEASLRPRPRPEPETLAAPDPAPPRPRAAEPAPPSGTLRGAEAESAGVAEGVAEGTSRDADGQGEAAATAGNAGASNYPGVVMRKINRTRKPKVGARGTATVGFEIAANGALARLVILNSSGNAAIDAAAMDHLQRAAPFPPPPAGAERRFQVAYESRG
jgi:periplasmic protein TonB